MACEILGELIIAAVELGVEVATDNSNEKSGCGCALIIGVLIVGGLIAYYYFG